MELTKNRARSSFLPYAQQDIDEQDIKAVVDVLKSDWLTTGPKIEQFEREMADYCQARYAVAVATGTAALHTACYAAGIKPGDEVITSPMTFAASANCILYQGGKPVFADIDPTTYNIDPEQIERKITARTKAIIPVDYTGQPAELDRIKEIAQRHQLLVIEDAAHSLGAEFKGQKVGSMAELTTLSFHPAKHITCGEGGMVLTDNNQLYNKMKQFRTHGIIKGSASENCNQEPWLYHQQVLGYNYRMTDLQAALGLSQLKKIDSFISRRREIAARYNDTFSELDLVEIPAQLSGSNSSWHLYIIKLKLEKLKAGRKEIFNTLRQENLGVNVHFIPVYYHPYYQKLGYKKGLCPVAEDLYERLITLPLFPKMIEHDVDYVVDIVTAVLRENILVR
ncbi:MAG: UDP-4-amino-4,6-dideoxy-N-acetyl-beta-L-altrosamine transaminase [Halanaerobiales bacterium]|nr:UDP-4-amino-4,6-dideoxy-N-acetyl-beta-L-altrosamine transaminase [Halanaerobiales bacterium]